MRGQPMLRPFALAGSFLLAACASAPGGLEKDANTGTVVIVLAADRSAQSFREFDLTLRRVDRSFTTDVSYTLRGMDADKADFQTDSETGVVLQRRLPPGEYEITDLVGDHGSFWWAREARPLQPIAVRFAVSPRSATYVGHFRVGLAQVAEEPTLALAVSDENSADIARAHGKYPELAQIAVAVAGDDAAASAHSGALATP